MPKNLKKYKNKDKALRYRNKQRKLNYEKGNFGDGCKRNWSNKEIQLILFPENKTDIELAIILKRSIQAIQIKRCRIKNINYSNTDQTPHQS